MEQPPIRPDGLQIDEHRPFQEKFWKAERIGWAGFGLLLLFALLGLTGSGGVFSRITIDFGDGYVDVPRFSRWQASDSLTASLPPGDSERRFTVAPAFFRTFQIEDIVPPPFATENGSDGTVYRFRSDPEAPLALTVHLRAQEPGIASYRVGVNGEAMQTTRTIVWP
ncbi:hypothetical protein [Sinorhizobium alkalisoli]|uniref:Uncharacterized protein n=1 Tax=Sinorhizobium alkalisoli TaxID=1752398 RepID=A0A1E3VCD6_9HYPH|nr:hypothetical protein [Sinorhizobium alkalisoli]MCA1491993.1 hypothetical protein [Ensifer sp. NBAIM29]MCG5479462.1 hypothetical protein [Sinorhizobium alkalisoli]ODR90536.1 hypothetical protein A8M32_14500 [Sinorhizobium alkalisoli]QFI67662.1 hypothetical protein EKH55_2788 [Sinorhizobium alkalisoli]